jgi:hypothetical protein
LYLFLKWVAKNYKSYRECFKIAKSIIESKKERDASLKGITIEEIDTEYDSMNHEKRLYLEQQKQKEIKALASEIYNDRFFAYRR